MRHSKTRPTKIRRPRDFSGGHHAVVQITRLADALAYRTEIDPAAKYGQAALRYAEGNIGWAKSLLHEVVDINADYDPAPEWTNPAETPDDEPIAAEKKAFIRSSTDPTNDLAGLHTLYNRVREQHGLEALKTRPELVA